MAREKDEVHGEYDHIANELNGNLNDAHGILNAVVAVPLKCRSQGETDHRGALVSDSDGREGNLERKEEAPDFDENSVTYRVEAAFDFFELEEIYIAGCRCT